ncbi:MAG: hypothetical protein JWP92_1706, partial [Caulobacter sp.]|nr:hypothetical protein [Caulobacter sp.]
LGSVALAFMFAPYTVLAQTAPSKADEATVEEVVVTGTSIRGVAPIGSALIGVGREAITQNAPANTKELLATVPQLGNFGVNAEQSTPDRFRTAGFQPNIHNLGIYATLTLFNGHRFAPVGGEAVFPDPSIIPVIAVQRVEVVADGASSVYGSDAVAGVVNFIYRKNVEGLEATATYGGNNTRYEKRDFGVIAGHSWSGGNITAAYEYSDNKSPLNVEIPTLALGGDQRSRGGRDLRGSNCLQPNVTANGATYAYPAWNVGRNFCGLLDQGTVIPDGRRHAVLVTAHQQVNDTVDLWTEINFSKYDTKSFGGQTSLNLFIPNTNPYFQAPPGVVTSQVQVVRSALGLFPSRFSTQASKVYGVTLGADIQLGNDWVGNTMFHASKTQDYNDDPELDLVNADAAARGTTKATALNIFGQAADNDPAVLASIDNGYRRINDSSQRLREFQIKADGPLFTLPGGQIRAAVGADFRNEQALQSQISGSPKRRIINVRDDDISRTVMAGFAELNVPLFSDLNAVTGIQALTLSLSGRYDYYEKYGGRFNPKVGAVWQPIHSVSVHGSYGTSFVAPNIGLTTSKFGYLGSRDQNTVITDWKTGLQIPRPFDIYNMGGGNPDLEPEEATTYSVGVDFAPDPVPGLRFGVSYYNVEYRNTIYKASLTDVITNPAFEAYRTINPTPAQMAAALAEAPPEMEVQPYVTWDVLFRSYAINLGVRKFEGLDFNASYDFRLGKFGSFNVAANANRKLTDKQQVLPNSPFNDRLGTDQAVRWKGRTAVTWNLDPLTVGLGVNYVDKYRYNNGSAWKNADAWITYDLLANYKLDKIREGLSIQGRVVNLFDEDPPFVDNANGYLPALASPFGRQFEMTVRAKF